MSIGFDSEPQTFTISNTTLGNVAIDSVSLTGTNPSDFIIHNDNCSGQTLAPAGTCTVQVVFLPTSAGQKTANLSIHYGDPDTATLDVPLSGTGVLLFIWYVDNTVASSGDGTNWSQAFKTIKEAVDSASRGDEIWVKMGTYLLASRIVVNEAICIYGGFAGWEGQRDQRDWETNVTTVDGQGSVGCFTFAASAIIDGFTITKAKDSAIANYHCSPTIANCTFSGNGTDRGGAIYSSDSLP